ncbi:hypothetical protein B4Q13_15450 [Lacticaseibacillus rhamnosus]
MERRVERAVLDLQHLLGLALDRVRGSIRSLGLSRDAWINLCLVGGFYFFAKLIRYAIWGWASFLLVEKYKLSSSQGALASTAFAHVGMPYIWGGTSDGTETEFGVTSRGGYDCSGFVWRVYKLQKYPGEGTLASVLRGRTTYEMSGEVPRTGGLERVVLNDKRQDLRRENLLTELHQRIRDVRQGPDGLIYLLTDEDPLGVDTFATHHLPLSEAPRAYEQFQKKEAGMVKVVFTP